MGAGRQPAPDRLHRRLTRSRAARTGCAPAVVQLEGLDQRRRRRCRRRIGGRDPGLRFRRTEEARAVGSRRIATGRGRRVHLLLQPVDDRRLAVDHAARVRRVGCELLAQPLVFRIETPGLALHLAEPRLDGPHPGLRAPGPHLLGGVRTGQLGLDPAHRRGPAAAARRQPHGQHHQHHGRDDREQHQLPAPDRPGIAVDAGPGPRPVPASEPGTGGAHCRPPRNAVAGIPLAGIALASRRAGGVGHDHCEASAGGPGPGRRQPHCRGMDFHGPGEVRGVDRDTVAFHDMRREPRTPPGLDHRQAADGHSGPGPDRVSGRQLAPRHRADQSDQRRYARIGSGGLHGRTRFGLSQRRPVADQDLGRIAVGGRERQPVGEALLGTEEQDDRRRLGCFRLRARPGRHGPEIEIAGFGVVLDLEAAGRADHAADAVVAERDAVDAGGGDFGRQLAMVGGLQYLHRQGRRSRAHIYKVCGKHPGRRQHCRSLPCHGVSPPSLRSAGARSFRRRCGRRGGSAGRAARTPRARSRSRARPRSRR